MTRLTQARALAGACFAAVALAVTAAPAGAQESAHTFNANPFKPTNGAEEYECIYPNGGAGATARSFFFDGTASEYYWRGLYYSARQGADGEEVRACQNKGELRVSRWERLTVAGQSSYIMRGGGGTNDAEVYGSSGIRFGHVLSSQLSKQTSVLTSYIPGRVGQAPASCNGKLYVNRPERGTTWDIVFHFYKPWQGSGSGARWDNYGNQAIWGPQAYSYLLWTWPALPIANGGGRNAGGGQIRATIASGQYIRACDVQPAYLPMYPEASGSIVGQVKMMYGRINNASHSLYGWFAVAYKLDSQANWTYFVESA